MNPVLQSFLPENLTVRGAFLFEICQQISLFKERKDSKLAAPHSSYTFGLN
jgi:hypothetical protein